MAKKGLSLVLLIITCSLLHSDGRNNTDSLKLYCTEYKLDLPGINEIFSAKWSPGENKILISGGYYDSSSYFYSKFSFFIIDTTRKRKVSRFFYYFTKFFRPSVHKELLTGIEEVLSFPSRNLRAWGDPHWLTDETFLFDAEKPYWNDPPRANSYFIYKFNISSKETTRLCRAKEEIPIMDVINNDILVVCTPREWFYFLISEYPSGVRSLHKINIKDCSKLLRLTPLHPDTLFSFSDIVGARYLPNNKIVYLKIFMPETDIYRKFEVLDLSNGKIQLLKKFYGFERGSYIKFDVSSNGKWLIYTSDTGHLRLLSIKEKETRELLPLFTEPSSILAEVLSCEDYFFEVLDWSSKCNRILCRGVNKKLNEEKLFIIELPKNLN